MAESGFGELQRIRSALADRAALKRQGVSDEWIHRCRLLVEEYDRLQQRFEALEEEVNSSNEGSSGDTVLM